MATVRQSITALYEESRKFAADGAPMMAVITSAAADGAPATDGPVEVRPLAAPEAAAIVARFEELRRLAEIEARQVENDRTENDRAENDQKDAGRIEEFLTQTADTTPFVGIETAGQVAEAPVEEAPVAANESDSPAEVTLPQEPPTPAAGAGADLDIGDIQELVRQAWEDEAGIGAALPRESSQGTAAEQPAATDAPAQLSPDNETANHDMANIEMAMEEIAAAVVQSGDNTAPVDVEAMKAEIITAMRNELKALVEADLTSAVRAAVAAAVSEAVASALAEMKDSADTASDMPSADNGATADTATTVAAAATKPPAKSLAKPLAKSAKKTAAKTVAKKTAAPKAATPKAATRNTGAKKAAKKAAVVKKLRADPTPDPDEA